MRQVVIVAPHFPPCNLAGVHRSRLLAMHLPKFGWRVRVLSVAPRYYEERLDPEISDLVPESVEVIRTRAFPTRPVRLVGDIGIRSLWWQGRELSRLIKSGGVDLVYITIPPSFTAVLGPMVHWRFGTRYALDYQDPWVHPWPGCEVRFSKAWCAFRLAKAMEPIVLRHVSMVTGVAPGYYEPALQRMPGRCPPSIAIPIGAEEADFRYLDSHPRRPTLFDPDDGNLHFVYAGAMLPRAYATLEAVLAAVRSTISTDWGRRLRLHFIGTGARQGDPESHTVRSWAERAGVSDRVHEHPLRIPYLDVLNHLKHAHAVLVFGSSEPHYTPSKVFQAIQSRRPVMGILHSQSTAAAILTEARSGPVVTFDDAQPVGSRVADITAAFGDVLEHGRDTNGTVNWRAFSAYSAEAVAARLAAAFDDVMEDRMEVAVA